MVKPVEIFMDTDSNREIHLFGRYVGVCFRGKNVTESIVQNGKRYTATVFEKDVKSGPSVSFISIRTFVDGTRAVDEESSVEGGLGGEKDARAVAAELLNAAQYIAERGWEQV